MKFWKAIVAGKLGIFCLNVGLSRLGGWFINYEHKETLRVARRGL